ELTEKRGGDRRHAGRRRARGFRALERAHSALEHRNRRVRIARVNEAFFLALEARFALLGAFINVALGEVERLRVLAELRAHDTAMHQARFGPEALGVENGAG